METYIEISTTVDDELAAEKLSRSLVEKRLAGCVQISPITSIYRWEGKIETAKEWRLCVKTRKSLFEEVNQVIVALSSYEVPEVIIKPILGGNEAYMAWLESELLL